MQSTIILLVLSDTISETDINRHGQREKETKRQRTRTQADTE